MFSVDSVIYNGKRHNNLDKLSELIDSLNSLQRIIISPLKISNKEENEFFLDSIKKIPKFSTFDEFLSESEPQIANTIDYFEAPFNHPLCILFSSGTTGEPKCLVHSVGVSYLSKEAPIYYYFLFINIYKYIENIF